MLENSIVIGVCVASLCTVAQAQQTDQKELLTVEDMEAVTGIAGITLVPRSSQMGAGGDLNFALADKTLLLTVGIQDAAMYDEWKSMEGFFHEPVPDLGDEAFRGPSFGQHRHTLIFRKGEKAISLSSFFNMEAGGEPFLNQEQLGEIARLVVARL
jgi:hypothetical protein